jgi:hypothetical protein
VEQPTRFYLHRNTGPQYGSALRTPSQEMRWTMQFCQFWLVSSTAEMSGFRFPVVPRDNYHGWLCADGHALCRGQLITHFPKCGSQLPTLSAPTSRFKACLQLDADVPYPNRSRSFVLWFTAELMLQAKPSIRQEVTTSQIQHALAQPYFSNLERLGIRDDHCLFSRVGRLTLNCEALSVGGPRSWQPVAQH